jgi:SulP family sulfate permease
LPNIVSGVIVGVVALPLAMAFAIASGAKPEQGLYTAIVAGLCVSVFGGSRLQIAGPTGAFVVVLSGVTAKHGIDGLQIATLMAGVILVLMGVSRLGTVIKYIPDPVIVGFTAGIGVIIFVGQWNDFFGLGAEGGEHFHQKFWHLLQAFPSIHWTTAGIGTISLLLTVLAPRVKLLNRIPGPLIATVVATAVYMILRPEGVATIGSAFGGIPRALPAIGLPEISIDRMIDLTRYAFAIAMLGAIESLLSAVVADSMAGTKHDSNQELVGQGIANIAAPIFGGFAATGAIARTATNIRNGGTSPLSGITHSLTLVLIIAFLAPLASNVPLAALSGILFVVAYNMSEVRVFAKIVKRAPRYDIAVMLVTFALTVFVDLVVAVNIGVILAVLMFMHRMASTVEVREVESDDVLEELSRAGVLKMPTGTLVYAIEGPLFFGAVENFERALAQTHTDPRVLLIRLSRVPFVDMTAIITLEESVRLFSKRGVRVLLSEANPRVKAKLQKAGVFDIVGADGYHDSFLDALAHCRELNGDEPPPPERSRDEAA